MDFYVVWFIFIGEPIWDAIKNMKPMNNLELPNENGDEIITPETEKSVKQNECDDIGKLRRKEYLHQYHQQNRDKIHEQKRGYYQKYKNRICFKNIKNRKFRNEYNKKYYQINKSELNCYRTKYLGQRYKTDILYHLKVSLRNRIIGAFEYKNFTKSQKTIKLLGCGWNELKLHIETQFKPGMTWNNHKQNGWHIDHIIPLSTAKTDIEMEKLCHYTNLQPLWWYENLSKGGNIITANKKA